MVGAGSGGRRLSISVWASFVLAAPTIITAFIQKVVMSLFVLNIEKEEEVSSTRTQIKKVKEEEDTTKTSDRNEIKLRSTGNQYFVRVGVGNTSIRNKIFTRLEKLDLIEKISTPEEKRKYLTQKQRFMFDKTNTIPYHITEYGFFYILSNLQRFPDVGPLLSKYYRKSIIVETLISRYFDKKTIEHHTPGLHTLLLIFLSERCQIVYDAIADIEDTSINEEKQEAHYKRLDQNLDWQARSFALRLLTSLTSSLNTSGRKSSKSIYDLPSLTESDIYILKNDKKFSKLMSIAVQDANKGYDKFVPRG